MAKLLFWFHKVRFRSDRPILNIDHISKIASFRRKIIVFLGEDHYNVHKIAIFRETIVLTNVFSNGDNPMIEEEVFRMSVYALNSLGLCKYLGLSKYRDELLFQDIAEEIKSIILNCAPKEYCPFWSYKSVEFSPSTLNFLKTIIDLNIYARFNETEKEKFHNHVADTLWQDKNSMQRELTHIPPKPGEVQVHRLNILYRVTISEDAKKKIKKPCDILAAFKIYSCMLAAKANNSCFFKDMPIEVINKISTEFLPEDSSPKPAQ